MRAGAGDRGQVQGMRWCGSVGAGEGVIVGLRYGEERRRCVRPVCVMWGRLRCDEMRVTRCCGRGEWRWARGRWREDVGEGRLGSEAKKGGVRTGKVCGETVKRDASETMGRVS